MPRRRPAPLPSAPPLSPDRTAAHTRPHCHNPRLCYPLSHSAAVLSAALADVALPANEDFPLDSGKTKTKCSYPSPPQLHLSTVTQVQVLVHVPCRDGPLLFLQSQRQSAIATARGGDAAAAAPPPAQTSGSPSALAPVYRSKEGGTPREGRRRCRGGALLLHYSVSLSRARMRCSPCAMIC